MPEPELTCPVDHAALRRDGEQLRCDACGRGYSREGETWDFRTVLRDATTGWDAAIFDQAYRLAAMDLAGGMEYALRTGIPRIAEEYRERHKGRRLEEFIRARQPARVLDLGCGNGWFCFRLAELSPQTRFCGVDVSPYCANLFSRRIATAEAAERMTAAIAAGEQLPFADAQFDAVILQEVLEHLRDPAQTLAEVARVLRPGGTALITTPTLLMTGFWRTATWVPRRLRRWWRGQTNRPTTAADFVYDRPLARREIRAAARRAGLEIVSWHRVIFLPHESYLQFLPGPLLRLMVLQATVLERLPGLGWLGLHHVLALRNAPVSATETGATARGQ